MAIRTIVKHPDPILREKAAVVTKFNANLHKLLDDMAETMYDADGVGLAAPQVGVSKRVIVMDCGEGLIEVVNPEIIAYEGEQFDYPEGCLSIPGLRGDVRRHKWIKLRGQDRYGNVFELEADDLLSRCAQHEIDHLNGILFIDIADRVYPISQEEEGE
ncbi:MULTISPECIES: peptide deformylase [Brevibacillus]|jgi:peptide deformylase|uniref:Peptide deformylase n=1 Tax=Brevibacillus aydinogluensis TaxID=927786 RepID=A0AA48RBV9_9BACL|nr:MULTISPECIES: peptide deformylase [Bacillales]MBR8658209.1 peptide deformylase [Brevibacillus sp. NL20B1]REK62959.1 MAG: peptide deformylase [Brevibacillus sp.]UFJ61105.1 peptide deformylase [Anoxybacillus sediminis]CAJ1002070.1 peptide deformylase [Brevibacillus aydinogluensis]